MSYRQGDDVARPSIIAAVDETVVGAPVANRRSHRKEIKTRFWGKVQQGSKEDCWVWTASKDEAGYGRFWNENKTVSAHRMAYELANGPIEGKQFVMHSCDNPSCCNPGHLSLGTAQENSADMVAKCRQACGERHGRSKLTDADVRAILASSGPLAPLADLYRVSKSVISSIRRRRHRRGHRNSGDGNG